MNDSQLLALLLVVIIIVILIILLYVNQQKLLSQREMFQSFLAKQKKESDEYVRNLHLMHRQELDQVKELYQSKDIQGNSSSIRQAEKLSAQQDDKYAKQIITDAEETAKSIISEAQEQAKLLLHKEEHELQKSIVKVVIQVIKKVLGKTLSYEEHKQIILDSLSEIT